MNGTPNTILRFRTRYRFRFPVHGVVALFCFSLSLCNCGGLASNREPTPDSAKQFLKLRGYNYDEKSFLAAAAASDLMAVNAFIVAGINPNAKDDSEGETALISAATTGNLELVKALVKGGADVNAKNKNGFGPLSRALTYNREEIAKTLLAQPAIDINVRGANDASVLMVYVFRDREDVVNSLLQRGSNVNLQDADGDTALHGAVKTGNLNVLRLLLTKGAGINVRNKMGATPLMWAGGYGQEKAAQILLEGGADPRLKDEQGRNAANWADSNRHPELGHSLREAATVKRQ